MGVLIFGELIIEILWYFDLDLYIIFQVGRRTHMVTMVMMVTRSVHLGMESLMVQRSPQETLLAVVSILLTIPVFTPKMELTLVMTLICKVITSFFSLIITMSFCIKSIIILFPFLLFLLTFFVCFDFVGIAFTDLPVSCPGTSVIVKLLVLS